MKKLIKRQLLKAATSTISGSGYIVGGVTGIISCTAVTLAATITIRGGIITGFTGC